MNKNVYHIHLNQNFNLAFFYKKWLGTCQRLRKLFVMSTFGINFGRL